MKQGIHLYTELIEHHRPSTEEHETPDMMRSARALLAFAWEREKLAVQGPWRLHRSLAQSLTRRHGYVPPGGWSALTGLLAGTDLLHIQGDSFRPALELAELESWTSAILARQLIEAFACRLIPPTTAAGLFLLIGLHPAWGLRLANAIHTNLGDRAPAGTGSILSKHRTMFARDSLEVVKQASFAAIAAILELLRALDPHTRYELELLAPLVLEACCMARRVLLDQLESLPQTGPPLLLERLVQGHDTAAGRALDFTLADLLEAWLIPAGIVRRFEDGSFCVFPEQLEIDHRVDQLDRAEQATWFARLLTGECCTQVA